MSPTPLARRPARERRHRGKRFIVVSVHRPEVARVEFPLLLPPGFNRRLIHREHFALQDGGEQGVIDRLQ